MRVVCINNKNGGDFITKGKIYDVDKIEMSDIKTSMAVNPNLIEEDLGDYIYYIKNDADEHSVYWSHQFITLETQRDSRLEQLGI
jgi:hypothetical protein